MPAVTEDSEGGVRPAGLSLCRVCQRNRFLLGHGLLNSVSKHSLHYRIFAKHEDTDFLKNLFKSIPVNIMEITADF